MQTPAHPPYLQSVSAPRGITSAGPVDARAPSGLFPPNISESTEWMLKGLGLRSAHGPPPGREATHFLNPRTHE